MRLNGKRELRRPSFNNPFYLFIIRNSSQPLYHIHTMDSIAYNRVVCSHFYAFFTIYQQHSLRRLTVAQCVWMGSGKLRTFNNSFYSFIIRNSSQPLYHIHTMVYRIKPSLLFAFLCIFHDLPEAFAAPFVWMGSAKHRTFNNIYNSELVPAFIPHITESSIHVLMQFPRF